MKAIASKRQKLLYIMLALTLSATGLTYYLEKKQVSTVASDVVPTIKPKGINLEHQQPRTPSPSAAHRLFHDATKDVFAVFSVNKVQPTPATEQPRAALITEQKIQTVTLPPALPAISTLPSQPVAPPLPFKYIGKLYGDGEYIVFLNMHGKSISVKTGDTIAQSYKVDEINPPLMTAIYLPLNLKQTIDIGAP